MSEFCLSLQVAACVCVSVCSVSTGNEMAS